MAAQIDAGKSRVLVTSDELRITGPSWLRYLMLGEDGDEVTSDEVKFAVVERVTN